MREDGLEQLWDIEGSDCRLARRHRRRSSVALVEARDSLRYWLLSQALDDEQLDSIALGCQVAVESVLQSLQDMSACYDFLAVIS